MTADRVSAMGDWREEAPPVVFVVDDDALTQALLCEVAQEAGWVARGFGQLADFRDALDREAPDLLVLDDDLPDGRGGDLARELREDARLRDVPVVVCTAAHPMRRAQIGAWAPVIAKPFNLGVIDGLLANAHPAARRGTHSQAG